jgi:hypothetical protein
MKTTATGMKPKSQDHRNSKCMRKSAKFNLGDKDQGLKAPESQRQDSDLAHLGEVCSLPEVGLSYLPPPAPFDDNTQKLRRFRLCEV